MLTNLGPQQMKTTNISIKSSKCLGREEATAFASFSLYISEVKGVCICWNDAQTTSGGTASRHGHMK